MRKVLTTLVVLLLFSFPSPAVNAQCSCGLQKYTPSTQPAAFVLDIENQSSSQNISLTGLNLAIDAASQDWNNMFAAREMSSVSVGRGGYATPTGTRITIVDEVGGIAQWDCLPGVSPCTHDKFKRLFVDKDYLSQSQDFLRALMLHEFGHKFGFQQQLTPGCEGKSIMNNTNPTSFKATFTMCDMQQLNHLFGEPPECSGDCGGPEECPDEYCGGGPPPAPGPSWCNPDLEFWEATSSQSCYSVCPIDSAPQLWNDEYDFCVGAWTSEMCFMSSGGDICGSLFGFSFNNDFGGGGGADAYMSSHSAVRGCSNYSEMSPVYMRTALECLDRCALYGADACEWASNGDCYVEFGDGCYVEFGHYGWSAAVLGGGGTGPGPGPGPNPSGLTKGWAVRGCSNYSDLGAVYKATDAECNSYCQGAGADACEWWEGNGDCYAEFGDGCYLEDGYGSWWGAVYNTEAAGTPLTWQVRTFNLLRLPLDQPRVLAFLLLSVAVFMSVAMLLLVTRRRLVVSAA